MYSLIVLIILLPLQSLAAGSDCGSYRIVYSQKVEYTNALGEAVTRDKKVTTKDTVASIVNRALKSHGVSSTIKRDYSAENLLKLMSQQEQALMVGIMRESLTYNLTIKLDLNKFSNRHDLSKLFNSCQEKISLNCSTKSKTCEIDEYVDKLACDPKGYLFEDISNTASNYDVNVSLNRQGIFNKIVTGELSKQFDILKIDLNQYSKDHENYSKQQEIIEKLKSILPETTIVADKRQGFQEDD